jgi:hypothetical protein
MGKKIIAILCQNKLYQVDIKDFIKISHTKKKLCPTIPFFKIK